MRTLWGIDLGGTKIEALGLDVVQGYAYVADKQGLRVIDVRDPTSPVEVGFCETPKMGEVLGAEPG